MYLLVPKGYGFEKIRAIAAERNVLPMNEYERWLSVSLDDPDLTEELKAIQDKPEEINDRFYRNLEFGTGGLRGVIGAGTNRMNVYTVRKAPRAWQII